MNHGNHASRSFGRVIYWIAGALLTLTLFSIWLVSGMYAKYTAVAPAGVNSARVAKTLRMELLEHGADYAGGIYTLNEDEVPGMLYDKVIPGVDIPKDPFIRLSGTSEVDFWLYVEVVPSKNFPKTVTYELTDKWEEVEGKENVYRYKDVIDSGTYDGEEIFCYLLKDNKLVVSERYPGKDGFSLTFKVWLEQAD